MIGLSLKFMPAHFSELVKLTLFFKIKNMPQYLILIVTAFLYAGYNLFIKVSGDHVPVTATQPLWPRLHSRPQHLRSRRALPSTLWRVVLLSRVFLNLPFSGPYWLGFASVALKFVLFIYLDIQGLEVRNC